MDKADDAPELTGAFFAAATIRDGENLVRRGRPKLAEPKRLVAIRFPPATLAKLRATGPGWQARVVKAVEKDLAGPTAAEPQPAVPAPHRPPTATPRKRRPASA